MDEIHQELLRTFPGELAAGEARMFAHGWTISVVREGLVCLASEEGLDLTGIQDVDITRWLRGEVFPRESLERLCRLFRCDQAQLGWPAQGNAIAISFAPLSTAPAIQPVGPVRGGRTRDWPAWFGMALSRLIALVNGWEDAGASEALQILIHQEVLMFDSVQPAGDEEPEYDPSRRQLLVTLLALPVAFGTGFQLGTASAAMVRTLLTQCAASITAAWHLLKQSDLAMVDHHVSGYMLALATLARQPSAHQAEAARLASLAHRVLGIVAAHRRQFRAVDHHFRQALRYAEIAGQPDIQASALLAASSAALLYQDDREFAAACNERVLAFASQITALQRARLHSALAIGLARDGQEQDSLRHLHLAELAFPAHPQDDPGFARQDFSAGQLVLYRGLAQLALARHYPDRQHQVRAWETFSQVSNLSGQGSLAERLRVEIVNHQAGVALEMRDQESFVDHITRGIQGARGLGSALRMHEAVMTYRRALDIWAAEPRVAAVAELFPDHPVQLASGSR